MNRLLAWSGVAILGVSLIASLSVSWNISNRLKEFNASALNDGIGAAKGNLYAAVDIINGGILQKYKHLGIADAAVYVSQAAGALTGIRTVAHDGGVDHISGIAMELQQVAFQMTHPDHYADSIKADEAFLRVAESQLDSSFIHGGVDKNALNLAIPKIYAAMSPQDSKVLYNAT